MADKKINLFEFNYISIKLREFFQKKGLLEACTQVELSILAACEDPTTIREFNFDNSSWPMIQTGQMHLEDIILHYKEKIPGVYCVTTSYRDEQAPIEGRHLKVFPMFEFEIPTDILGLETFQRELLEHLGFGSKDSFPSGDYLDICKKYGTDELTHEHEMMLYKDYGNVFFLKHFPESSFPYFNMARNNDGTAKKIDVILMGQESLGSAERSVDPDMMKNLFHTISNGEYAGTLYKRFGKSRVDAELTKFLSNDFFVRSGCGIGLTRLARAMRMMNLLPSQD